MIGQLIINTDKTITLNTGEEIIKYQFASFGARLGARIIDILIIIIPNSIIPVIPAWLYWSLQQSGAGQATIGQNALGIKTLGIDGSKISFGRATGRFFATWLSVLTLMLGYLMFFLTENNQCLHDYLSGCIVVKEIQRDPVDQIMN